VPDPKIDPELLRQLECIQEDEEVQAIVHLRTEATTRAASAPEQTVATAHAVVDRVQKMVGEHESQLNIFRNLSSFMICAQPRFLRALMSQPEVAAVAANKQPESGLIEPVRKRPADLQDVGTERSGGKGTRHSRSDERGRRARKKG